MFLLYFISVGTAASANKSNRPKTHRGHHECAIFGRGPEAAESAAQWGACRKNPGHRKFIPVNDFTMDHLPQTLQKTQIFSVYKSIANLTVRLRVGGVSLDRPEDDSLADLRGTSDFRVGTGLIVDVVTGGTLKWQSPITEDTAFGGKLNPCPCHECDEKVVRKWCYVHVYTVSHVVFNTEEAKSTQVDLFYDDESSHLDGRMKSLWGFDAVNPDPERDFNVLRCVSHDEALGSQLAEYFRASTPSPTLREYLKDATPTWDKSEGHDVFCGELGDPGALVDLPILLKNGIILIISHPHGQPKQVTLGSVKAVMNPESGLRWDSSKRMPWTECRKYDGHVSWEYNAATCPGSSGAIVLIMDTLPSISGVMHSGANNKTKNHINYSATGPYWGKFLDFNHGW